jgi:hypothetical protein
MGVGRPLPSDITKKFWICFVVKLYQMFFYPRPPEELHQMRSDLTKERFSDLLALWMRQTGSNKNLKIFC